MLRLHRTRSFRDTFSRRRAEGKVGELRILSGGKLKLRVARRSQCQRNLRRELLRQIFLKPLPAQASKNMEPPLEQPGRLLHVPGLAQSGPGVGERLQLAAVRD